MPTKISAMTTAGTIEGTELVPIVQSSANKKTTVEALMRKPVYEIDLSAGNFSINDNQYGLFYVTTGTTVLAPNEILLPDPATNEGLEIMIFNYDQTNDATFGGSNLPYIESSTSLGDKYNEVPTKQSVLLVAINGYWNACSFKI